MKLTCIVYHPIVHPVCAILNGIGAAFMIGTYIYTKNHASLAIAMWCIYMSLWCLIWSKDYEEKGTL